MENTLIEISDMCKIYNPGENEVRALEGVDLQISENEFVAIIGHSGSGKSTLMNMLGCLDVPTSGKYLLHNQDVSDLEDDELSDVRNREIGFIFQGFNLFPHLTIEQNVEIPMLYGRVDRTTRRKRAHELIERVGLGHRFGHRPNQLSGGECQRVAIARALSNHPSFLLADEPTGNLDEKTGLEIMKLFHELNDSGVTIIMVTHNPDLDEHFDQIVHLRDGRIVHQEYRKK